MKKIAISMGLIMALGGATAACAEGTRGVAAHADGTIIVHASEGVTMALTETGNDLTWEEAHKTRQVATVSVVPNVDSQVWATISGGVGADQGVATSDDGATVSVDLVSTNAQTSYKDVAPGTTKIVTDNVQAAGTEIKYEVKLMSEANGGKPVTEPGVYKYQVSAGLWTS